ncbi:Protein translocase subunit SecY [ANME-1 cluster archaeon GoMg2]|nr:Protein translocase subunit SecY [ANME-1 cluster archaeon GoMg2]
MGLNGLSVRDALTFVLTKIPMVERPRRYVPLKAKLLFTAAILILYFAMGNIPLFGLSPESMVLFGQWRALFAGERFSLSGVGIMPIISASLILQILAGPKLMKLDLSNPRDQAFYLNLHKMIVLCFVFLNSISYAVGFYMPDLEIAYQLGVSLQFISFLIFLQVFFGGILIYYMEGVVTKWGVGSGIGIFIMAGVTQQLFTGFINWMPDSSGLAVGVIPRWIEIAQQVEPYKISEGGLVFLFQNYVIALITTVALFLLVIYLTCTRIEIKIPGYLKRRSSRGLVRFPIKLMHFSYAIVAPLVFFPGGWAILASIQGFGRLLLTKGITTFGTYDAYGNPITGCLAYYLNPVYSPNDWVPTLVHSIYPDIAVWQIAVRVAVTASIMAAGAMLIALIWLKLTPGLETRDINAMVRDSGLPIYGHRSGLKAIKRAVDRSTPKISILGCGILGALLVVANMFGTLGNVNVLYLFVSVIVIYDVYGEISTERGND